MARTAHITPGIGVAAACTLPQCTETLSPVPGRTRSHSASSDELRSFRCCLIFWPRPIFIDGANDKADQHGDA